LNPAFELVRDRRGGLRAVATGIEEEIPAGLVRAVDYYGQPIAGLPYDADRGVIRNLDGRVVDERDQVVSGQYVVGWIKRGPSGVIGSNKKDASGMVAAVLADRDAGELGRPGRSAVDFGFGSQPVSCAGWQTIDAHETGLGERAGRPRVKLVRVDSMLDIAQGAGSAQPSPIGEVESRALTRSR
jgi:ferredoxin/flavodoxin---NADP+ reductase